MPLSKAKIGAGLVVKKIIGKEEIKNRLEQMGFVAGSPITVVSAFAGNIIVRIKDSRVAISREMAGEILV